LRRLANGRLLFLLMLARPVLTLPQTSPQKPIPGSQSNTAAIRLRTQLVLIPTEVTNARGNRITDMKKEDFAVFENDKRQEIAFFEHVVTKAAMTKPTELPPGEFTNTFQKGPNRITIFVVDLLNSRMEEQKEARKQIFEFLSKSLDEKEPVCLIVVDGTGAWLVHEFTTDPKILADAVNEVKEHPTDIDRPPNNPEERLYKTLEGWHSKNAERAKAGLETRLNMLREEVGFEDMDANDRIRLTLVSLLEIGNAFAGIPGRKSLIWATAGFPFQVNNAAAFEKEGALHASDGPDLLPLYEQTWRVLGDANIAVYPLDVSDLVNPGYGGPSMGEALPRHVTMDMHVSNLENFADMTGGKFCDRSVNAKECFEQATSDSSDYYVLGIYDKSGTEKPGWRKLNVRTPRPGLQIRARSGYFVSAAKQEAPTEKKLMEMALFSPFDYTGLSLSVRFTGMTAGRKPETKKIHFEYTIPAGAVRLSKEDENQLKLEFGATARDASGKMAGSFTKVVEGKLGASQAQQVNEKGIVFKGELELGAGEYALSFAVMDQINENTGSVSAPLKVE